jgi:glyoxylase-like metal-dependent hydrolase (beta-lactamase superfamily II)/rhodanese-related sulfurtransferase
MITVNQSAIAISAEELRETLDRRDAVTVLDVRPIAERAEWAIPGSRHVDAYDALRAGDPDAVAGIDVPLGDQVVTVCAGGKMSLVAAEQLRARGIAARSLTGGMKAWSLVWNTAELTIPGSSATVIQMRRTGKGCLSYLVGAGREAAVIDASLAPEVYREIADARGWTITAVFDTHVHADHLSRSRLLAEQTGATLHLPATNRAVFPFTPLRDSDQIMVGDARLTAIDTPGHTPESMSYLLDGLALFTGDTLFLTGVGRPDLEASVDGARERAGLLWGSLRRLAALAPETLILPGHTSSPVAFDGRPVAATLRAVTEGVPMMRLTEAEFVETILARIPPTPPNHSAIVAFNEAGELPEHDPTDLEAGANRCAVA